MTTSELQEQKALTSTKWAFLVALIIHVCLVAACSEDSADKPAITGDATTDADYIPTEPNSSAENSHENDHLEQENPTPYASPDKGKTSHQPPIDSNADLEEEDDQDEYVTLQDDGTKPEDDHHNHTSINQPDKIDQQIEVVFTNGSVQIAKERIPIDRGTLVEIIVTSDVFEHVHIHGYDLFFDVAAGETTKLRFSAEIPGVFEIEFEDSFTFIGELEVS